VVIVVAAADACTRVAVFGDEMRHCDGSVATIVLAVAVAADPAYNDNGNDALLPRMILVSATR
jgi:hypothetical protein